MWLQIFQHQLLLLSCSAGSVGVSIGGIHCHSCTEDNKNLVHRYLLSVCFPALFCLCRIYGLWFLYRFQNHTLCNCVSESARAHTHTHIYRIAWSLVLCDSTEIWHIIEGHLSLSLSLYLSLFIYLSLDFCFFPALFTNCVSVSVSSSVRLSICLTVFVTGWLIGCLFF